MLGRPQSLHPLHLWAKSVIKSRYWPNRGLSYPERFYRGPPPFALQLHVVRHAVVTERGDVIGDGRKQKDGGPVDSVVLARYFCKETVSE